MGKRGPGTEGAVSPGFGGVIKGDVVHGDVGVNSFTGARGRTSTKGGAGMTPVKGTGQQGSMDANMANSMNQYAFEKQMNVWEHGQKLAGQNALEQYQHQREGQSIRNQLAASALSKLNMASPEDVRDLAKVHEHLESGDDYAVKAHIDSYNSRRQAMGQQLQEHVQAAAPEGVVEGATEGPHTTGTTDAPEAGKRTAGEHATAGFTAVAPEPAVEVGDREKSDKIGAPAPDKTPEGKTPPTNVPGAAANLTEGTDVPLQDKPVVKEANAKINEAAPPVATPASAAGNPDTKAPTPQAQAPAVSEAVSDKVTSTLPEGIPVQKKDPDSTDEIASQQKLKADAAAAPAPQNRRQRVASAVVGQVQDFREKAAARKVVNDAAEAKLDKEHADRRAAAAAAAAPAQAGTPSESDTPGAVTPADASPPSGTGSRNAHFDAGRGAAVVAGARTGATTGAKVTQAAVVPLLPESGGLAEAAVPVGTAVGAAVGAVAAFKHHADAEPGRVPGADPQGAKDRPRYLAKSHPDGPAAVADYNKRARAHAATLGTTPLPAKPVKEKVNG